MSLNDLISDIRKHEEKNKGNIGLVLETDYFRSWVEKNNVLVLETFSVAILAAGIVVYKVKSNLIPEPQNGLVGYGCINFDLEYKHCHYLEEGHFK